MNIFYLTNIRMPTERAHGIQVMKMCEAFADNGVDVTLLVPNRKTFDEDPYDYYAVKRNFKIEKVGVPDFVSFGKLGFLLESLVFAYRAIRRVKKERQAIIYTREELPLLFLSRRTSCFYEAHQIRRSRFLRYLIKRATGIVAISNGLALAIGRMPYPKEKILVAHDGYDPKQFAIKITQKEARERLGLPLDKKIAMYIGGLESWKGCETLCKASELLNDDVLVVVIGGKSEEINALSEKYPKVKFLGARPYRDLPSNQQAADVLVIPNSGKEDISRLYTSPLKLFAHMASGIPIVASDIPSLREILTTNEQAYLVASDNPAALVAGIQSAIIMSDESLRKTSKALESVNLFFWDKRVLAIVNWVLLCSRAVP